MKKIILAMIMCVMFSAQALAQTATQKDEIYNDALIMIKCAAFYESLSELALRSHMEDMGKYLHELRNGYRLAGTFYISGVVKENELMEMVENIYETTLTSWRPFMTTSSMNNDPYIKNELEVCAAIAELQNDIVYIMREGMYRKSD